MRYKTAITLSGAALCAGVLAVPAHAAPPSPSWIEFTMSDRSAPGRDERIQITAGQGDTDSCKGCTVVIEFRAEGKKAWKKAKNKVFKTNGYAMAHVIIKGDGAYRVRSLDGKVKSKVHKLEAGHVSAVKVNRPTTEPKAGSIYALTGKAITKIDDKWRGIKGREVCLYGAGEKKITCTTTKKKGTFTMKVKASTRGLILRSTATDAYMAGGSTWFWLIYPN